MCESHLRSCICFVTLPYIKTFDPALGAHSDWPSVSSRTAPSGFSRPLPGLQLVDIGRLHSARHPKHELEASVGECCQQSATLRGS